MIIIAASTAVDTTRFVGKKVYQADITACFEAPKVWLADAVTHAQLLTEASAPSVTDATDNAVKKIVAITACPTGVAHTFMAAEALTEEGQRQGYDIKVETRGSVGAKNQLTDAEIAAADLVIIAADIGSRFSTF